MPEISAEIHSEKPNRNIPEELKVKLKSALYKPDHIKYGDDRKRDKAIYEKQDRYISLLPENILEQLQAHLFDKLTEHFKWRQKRNEFLLESGQGIPEYEEIPMEELIDREIKGVQVPDKEKPSVIIQGELFEAICKIQSKQEGYLTKNRGVDKREKESLRLMADTVLSLISHPEKHKFPPNNDRVPDIVDFQVDKETNTLHIRKIFEAKSGKHLNQRSLKQLRDSGFKKTFSLLVDKLNVLDDAGDRGLSGFGKTGMQIVLDNEVTQTLMVCRGLKPKNATFNQDIDKLIGDMSKEEKAEYKTLLKDNKTEFIESPFSNSEIRALTRIFLKEIQNNILKNKLKK